MGALKLVLPCHHLVITLSSPELQTSSESFVSLLCLSWLYSMIFNAFRWSASKVLFVTLAVGQAIVFLVSAEVQMQRWELHFEQHGNRPEKLVFASEQACTSQSHFETGESFTKEVLCDFSGGGKTGPNEFVCCAVHNSLCVACKNFVMSTK